MTLVFHSVLLGFPSQGFYELQIESCMNTVGLVFKPYLLMLLLGQILHESCLEDNLLFPGLGGGQTKLNLVLSKKLF